MRPHRSKYRSASALLGCCIACGADQRPATEPTHRVGGAARDASAFGGEGGPRREADDVAADAGPPMTIARDPNCVFRDGISGGVKQFEAASGRLFVGTSDGGLVAIEPETRRCEVLRTAQVVAVRRIDKLLHYVVREPDRSLAIFTIDKGESRLRSRLTADVANNFVFSEIDGAPMVFEAGQVWVERGGGWTNTQFDKFVIRPEYAGEPIVLGAGRWIYVGFPRAEDTVLFVIGYPSGTVVRRKGRHSVNAIAKSSRPDCVLVGEGDGGCFGGSSGGLRTQCGLESVSRMTFDAASRPKWSPDSTASVHWLGTHGTETIVMADGIRRLAAPKAPVKGSDEEPVCMCGYLIGRPWPGVFRLVQHEPPSVFFASE
jgi:hypothetical protein